MTNHRRRQYVVRVSHPIAPERVAPLLDRGVNGTGPVVYWMQASQRVEDNLALAHAADAARELSRPLVVVFGLTSGFPEANTRHYQFLLEGLVEVAAGLKDREIGFAVRLGHPYEAVTELPFDPSVIVTDAGYLWEQRLWRKELIRSVNTRVIQVEDNVVVPVRLASNKEEYAARTIRKKINKHRDRFLEGSFPEVATTGGGESMDIADGLFGDRGVDLSDGADSVLALLDLDETVRPSPHFTGGGSRAQARFDAFIEDQLP